MKNFLLALALFAGTALGADQIFIEAESFRNHGYPVPYRCFYSRNVENLFMAGRDVSVTHEALGTVRVMKTGGMIGEVVGKAASLCVKMDVMPRAIYERYFPELQELLRLPGLALDDSQAKLTGKWAEGHGLPGYYGAGYRYRGAKEAGAARYEFAIEKAGTYEVRLSYSPHENRATKAPVTIESADGAKKLTVNERIPASLEKGLVSLGKFRFAPDKPATVIVGDGPADGNVAIDVIQLLPVD